MSITYNELVTQTPQQLRRANDDLIAEMPRLIKDAEEEVILQLDHDLFRTIITGKSVSVGNAVVDLTDQNELMEVRSISMQYRSGDQAPALEMRNQEYLEMLFSVNRPGRPRYYSNFEEWNKIKVWPTPNETYDLTIHANVEPTPLSGGNPTNVISDKFPRVIQMAVFLQGAHFMKNDSDIARYEGELAAALTRANAAISRRRRDEVTTRPTEAANAVGR